VKAGLEKLAHDTQADEVIAVTDTYEHSDRLESYRRVAAIAGTIDAEQNMSRNLASAPRRASVR
jgi:hypothetical protein